ncbi:hypothetical protein SERLA73DRAFT_169952 [Serpula lacrymans var. lacrymans S7.3]|uniref:Piwi domain-containing protein n=1 Tax=Serpula lacrymans var. lacrymans (strain S7.3) TaxID=936435 RepID=F8Q3D8_SERL3|nr:hypothetical protein SERLA73DRAFT_169952 [Serpula lacrymans var. lacrymans S7.3]
MSNRGQSRGGGGGGGHRGQRGMGGRGGGGGGRGDFRGGGGGDFRGGGGGGGGGSGGQGGPRGGFGGQRGGPPGDIIFARSTPANIDQRLSSLNQLVSSFKELSVNPSPERPPRPGFGTLGREITLRANFFPVKIPKGVYYDYHIDFTPTTDIKKIKARLFWLLEQSTMNGWREFIPFVAHDRSERLISAKKLPQPLDVPIKFYEEGESGPKANAKVYTVSINFVRELDTSELVKHLSGASQFRDYDTGPLISGLNLVLQQHAGRTGYRVGQNKYFYPSQEKQQLSLGVEAWKGFFISVRPVYKELMVNVNVCMTAFYTPGNLANAMVAFQQQSRGGMPPRFVQKLKVATTYRGYKMKKAIYKISGTTARKSIFQCDEYGGRISVEVYFKKKFNITLRHADDLPLVDLGNKAKSMLVPAELCEIEVGEPFRGKLSDKETASMIKFACNPPAVNANSIVNQGLPTLALTAGTRTAPVEGFGISIVNDMAVVPGRELPPPKLNYRNGRPPNVKDGSWNILDVTFHQGGVVNSWWVLVVRDGDQVFGGSDDPKLTGIWQGFGNKLKSSGMALNSKPMILSTLALIPVHQDPGRIRAIDQIRQIIKAKLGPKKPSFILVILSGRDNYIYPGIKRLCDVELGVHTIHMLTDKVLRDSKKQDQYFSNVALKANTKLGGVNHKLDPESMKWLTTKRTMVVGMDVTHPGPTSVAGTPSIAAVVASVDSTFVQFPASMRIQKSKQEMIDALTSMMVERLLVYKAKNKCLPERVYVYRDGVSEGQFDVVLENELPQILDSFKKLKAGTEAKPEAYRPKLTIIICGKRHHARFYPTDSAFADRNGNTRPGTVVDKGITAVFDFDFYLQAHAGLQGSVKATHYTVIYDENRLGADEVQQGTNTISYLYARATKAVSLAPAAYYADLACERGRCYINDFLNADDKQSSAGTVKSSGKGRGKLDKEEEEKRVFESAEAMWGQGVHEDLKDSMFYI